MDSIIPQDLTRNRNNNRCTKVDKEHDKNSRRNKYNNYRDRRNDLEIKQKQLDNEHHKYPWDIRRPMESNSKQYEKLSIPNSINASWWIR